MGDEEVGGGQLACFNTFLHLPVLLQMFCGSLYQIEDQLCIQYIDIRLIDGEYNNDDKQPKGVTAILVFLPPSRPGV